MTSFDTLIYTDCVPGQGLRGTAGLQFQARSSELALEAAPLVQGSLLYEAPQQWMLDRRPVSDYPLSFGHLWDGRFATARGRYLGKEANGSREGNQLTHALVTGDPEAYQLVRPAQLFGALFWADGPAPTTTSEPVTVGGDLGRYAADRLRDFVFGSPDGAEQLVALLTALLDHADPDAPRVVFVSEDPDPVLRWIAAATLLMPQKHALRVGFKVFSTNPSYAVQRVLGVHPEWTDASLRVGNEDGTVVFDLESGRYSAVSANPIARTWVELFTSAEDPFDVVDMVEIAGATDLAPELSLAVARAASLDTPPPRHLTGPVVGWLDGGKGVEHYGEVVATALIAEGHELDEEVLRALDALTWTGRFPGHGAKVRLELVSSELNSVLQAQVVPAGRLDDVVAREWPADAGRQRHDMFARELRLASGSQFEAVLRLAHRHRVTFEVAELVTLAAQFVHDWVAHPDREYRVAEWPDGAVLLDLLRDQLVRQLEHYPGEETEDFVGDSWWRRLLTAGQDADPESPLDAALLSAAVYRGDAALIGSIVRGQLARARRQKDPATAWTRTVAVLWRRRGIRREEVGWLLAESPPEGATIDPRALQGLVDDLVGRSVTHDRLRLFWRLEQAGLYRDPQVQRVLDDNEKLNTLATQGLEPLDETGVVQAADVIRTATASVRVLYSGPLVNMLLQTSPRKAELLLGRIMGQAEEIEREVCEKAVRALRDNDPERKAWSWALYVGPRTPDGVVRVLDGPVDRWMRETKDTEWKAVAAAAAAFGPWYAGTWKTWDAERAASREQRRTQGVRGWLPGRRSGDRKG